jgi:O-antigen/teichoic acid export membrane protein
MAANVLQFVFYSVLSRVVGVEQYGVLTSLFSATLLIATGPATVAGTIVARLSADLRAAGDMQKIRRLGDVVTGSTALIGFGAFLLAVAVAGPIAGYLRLASTQPVIITGVALGLSFAIPVQRGIFQGTEKFGAFALSNIVEAAVKVIAGSLLALRFGVDGALAGLAIAFFLSWSYNVVTLRSLGNTVHRLTLDVRDAGGAGRERAALLRRHPRSPLFFGGNGRALRCRCARSARDVHGHRIHSDDRSA